MRPILLAVVALAVFGAAQTTPAPGSPLRKEILDAGRAVVEKDLGGRKVKFRVDHLKVSGEWAFLTGAVLNPQGGKFDYKGTRYQEMIEAEAFDDGLSMLLRRTQGAWRVRAFALGATDVPWVDWPEKYRAPRAIFPFGQ